MNENYIKIKNVAILKLCTSKFLMVVFDLNKFLESYCHICNCLSIEYGIFCSQLEYGNIRSQVDGNFRSQVEGNFCSQLDERKIPY